MRKQDAVFLVACAIVITGLLLITTYSLVHNEEAKTVISPTVYYGLDMCHWTTKPCAETYHKDKATSYYVRNCEPEWTCTPNPEAGLLV